MFFKNKPEKKTLIGIELYRRERVSLARAAETAGMDFESFKEVLADRGIKIRTASPTEKELEEEIKYLEMSIVKKIEVTDKRIIKLEFILAQT